jgi:diaminopimelate epimerase
MRLRFTKMQGAGNDFVVVDATRRKVELSREQWRWVAHRQFGVGADQILIVELPPPAGTPGSTGAPSGPAVDFVYRIFNADGGEVEQCGNGARCFVKFVRDQGLTDKRSIRVQTRSGIIEPRLQDDGRVEVDMGAPVFAVEQVPFSVAGLTPRRLAEAQLWPLTLEVPGQPEVVRWIEVISMGNPHAVQVVESVKAAPVLTEGPRIERHPRFPRRVNAGYMEIVSRREIRLRVYERGAGETLACGTGACAAVVSGIHCGLLDDVVEVATRGGPLTIRWAGGLAPVMMTGPATTVFSADIEVPEHPVLPD